MILIGRIIRMYTERQQKKARGERVVRESSTLTAAAEVWSDVASSMSLGFRSSDSGPLLYSDEADGPQLQIGVYEAEHDLSYHTVATVSGGGGAHKGSLSVRPSRGLARLAKGLMGASNVPDALAPLYFVRASDEALVTRLLGDSDVSGALTELVDRAPLLSWDDGEVTLVLEGVELVHERMESLIRALHKLHG